MSKAKICIILNPCAKGERARNLENRLRTLIPEAHLEKTKAQGHAEDLARRAAREGYGTVAAAGGDGTINEVVNGIAGSGVNLGILPVGTVNVFAMELGLPTKLDAAVKVLRSGSPRLVDLPEVNSRRFVQLAGVGLDAQTVKETDWDFKKALGPLSYVVTASQVVARKAPLLKLKADGGKEWQGAFVLIGNGRFYGGPFPFFPKANTCDGLLDVCVFEKMSHFDLVRYFQGILTGRLTKHFKDVKYFQTSRLTVSSDVEVPLEVDGELHGVLPAEFKVKKAGLSVLVNS